MESSKIMQSSSKYVKNIAYFYNDETDYNDSGYKIKRRPKSKLKKFKKLKNLKTYEQ